MPSSFRILQLKSQNRQNKSKIKLIETKMHTKKNKTRYISKASTIPNFFTASRIIIELTEAGGEVSGLSSTYNSISVFISLSSTGSVAILLALTSSLANRRNVTSTGRHNSRLLRSIRLLIWGRSLKCCGRWVNWLDDASNSVNEVMRPNSSGRELNLEKTMS